MDKLKIPIYPVNQFVKYIWLYESPANSLNKEVQTFVVEGCPMILFHFKQPLKCKSGNNDWVSHPKQCVIGQIKSYGEIVESGNEGMIAIVFHPDGLYPFIKIPVDEITGQIVDLTDVFGKGIKEIQEKICEAKTDDLKVSLVENLLLNLVKSNTNQYSKEIRYSISQMRSDIKINISDLSSAINMSKRNFERRFLEYVGLTPVFYNRIVRFQKALHLMNKNDKPSFTELAYSAGYFDQSHFIRDFKQFYGQAPKEFSHNQNFG
jgi:AraC-like DNA-binding protein